MSQLEPDPFKKIVDDSIIKSQKKLIDFVKNVTTTCSSTDRCKGLDASNCSRTGSTIRFHGTGCSSPEEAAQQFDALLEQHYKLADSLLHDCSSDFGVSYGHEFSRNTLPEDYILALLQVLSNHPKHYNAERREKHLHCCICLLIRWYLNCHGSQCTSAMVAISQDEKFLEIARKFMYSTQGGTVSDEVKYVYEKNQGTLAFMTFCGKLVSSDQDFEWWANALKMPVEKFRQIFELVMADLVESQREWTLSRKLFYWTSKRSYGNLLAHKSDK